MKLKFEDAKAKYDEFEKGLVFLEKKVKVLGLTFGLEYGVSKCHPVYSRFHFYRFLLIPIPGLQNDSRFRFFYGFLQSIILNLQKFSNWDFFR